MNDIEQTYLGDGVYAIFDGSGIWLHANSHDNPTDKVYLEPDVLKTLNEFYDRVTNQKKQIKRMKNRRFKAKK